MPVRVSCLRRAAAASENPWPMTEKRNMSPARTTLARGSCCLSRKFLVASCPQMLLAVVIGLTFFFDASTRVSAEGVITTIHELKSLTPDQASKGRSLHLSGVVVCYDSGWNQLYICDGHETGYFNPHNFTTHPQLGQMVEVWGVLAGENILTNAQLTVVGPGTIPEAKKLKLSELGSDWCEWIETSGRVLSAESSSGRPALLLQANSQNCLVYVLGGPP